MMFQIPRDILIPQIILNTTYWILAIMIFIPIFKGLQKTKNKYNKAFAAIITIFISGMTAEFIVISSYILRGEFFMVGQYPVILLLMNIMITSFFVFMCNLYNWKKYYIVVIFIGIVQAQLGIIGTLDGEWESSLFGILMFGSVIGAFIFNTLFFYKGIKNRDGLILTFGFFIAIAVYNLFFVLEENSFLEFQINSLVGLIPLIFGATGLLDKYLFFDRKERDQIQNAWITTVVSKKNKKIKSNKQNTPIIKPKVIHILCPICKVSIHKKFSAEEVEKRKNNPKGLVSVLVTDNGYCEHKFIAFVDRNFMARGAESIDL